MKRLQTLTILAVLALLAACNPGPESPKGFSLPEGDIEAGRQVFLDLKCNSCHSLPDIPQLQASEDNDTDTAGISVALGGEVSRVRTYGELVTSVINPSHRIARGYPITAIQRDGESKMPNYNGLMTVEQLIDLVVFLESKYELSKYESTRYRNYYPYL